MLIIGSETTFTRMGSVFSNRAGHCISKNGIRAQHYISKDGIRVGHNIF